MADLQVYIPVYNDIRYLPKALESVLAQREVDVEIVVSDNASTDGTYELASELARRHTSIHVHRNARNLGAVANLNLFKERVEASFYMVLCSDDVLLAPDALSKALAVMRADEAVVSVYCDMRYIDGSGRRLTERRFDRQGHFEASAVLKRCILEGRNLFGIPLLHRFSAAKDTSYPEALTYTGDIFHSAKVAERGSLYHIAEPLIGNRFTGRNLTSALQTDSQHQFGVIAELCNISLSRADRMRAGINALKVRLARSAFLFWAWMRS